MSHSNSTPNSSTNGHYGDEAKMSRAALTLAALGIVFGDIGTSPLYAVREAFHGPNAIVPSAENILGVLSLIVWSLITVISVKYLMFVMRADNKGEGGVLALTALASPPQSGASTGLPRLILYLGLFGSALLFGDGVITPAISVLSAIEGLKVATPFFEPYVIPITLGILFGLFSVQRHGTGRIGRVFGPVILLWFLVIGALGIFGITKDPVVLRAIDPSYGLAFLSSNGIASLAILGAVFLVVTGGEALYADMGHLGKSPIQTAWFVAAFPALLLNYFGQGALILTQPEAVENPFYLLAPSWALYVLVVIATMATVIASQALISGVYSLTRQAIQLGFFPRMKIIHTSSHEIGQIYIPSMNWIMFALTAWLVITFGSSSALASAYGIAVSTTMVITTVLACTVAWGKWNWKWYYVAGAFVVLVTIDLVFFVANLTKIADGGWFPLTLGAVMFTLMTTWRKGRQILARRLAEQTSPLSEFLMSLRTMKVARVPGSAIFMSGSSEGTPLALAHNVRHNRVLHQKNAILTVLSEEVPHIDPAERLELTTIGEGFYRLVARYGFMESPDINDILKCAATKGVPFELSDITFFLGRETILPTHREGMAIWRERIFAFMSQNSERATAFFNIPPDQVVEVGFLVEF